MWTIKEFYAIIFYPYTLHILSFNSRELDGVSNGFMMSIYLLYFSYILYFYISIIYNKITLKWK